MTLFPQQLYVRLPTLTLLCSAQIIYPLILLGKKKYTGIYYEDPDSEKSKVKFMGTLVTFARMS